MYFVNDGSQVQEHVFDKKKLSFIIILSICCVSLYNI